MDFTHLNLPFIWFILIGILFAGYAILDGFDLGLGALHLFTRTDTERRMMINAIGPVWDGNEVWLVTGGGALFAAFPDVYATLASGLYPAVMLLLFSLIFRAIAIEFRSKQPMGWWRTLWDASFSASSVVASLVFGVALGNLVIGLPVGPGFELEVGFLELFKPYPLLVGVTVIALFMMHGSIYAVLKFEGELQEKVLGWVNNSIIFFIICYALTTMATLVYLPGMTEKFRMYPLFFIFPVLNMLAIANIPREIHHRRYFMAFLSSCCSVAALLLIFGIGVYPNITVSTISPQYTMTIYNVSSSTKSLNYMFNIALLGMPFVLAYTICIYWIFRGKVRLTEDSY